jgi:hypothetical protein
MAFRDPRPIAGVIVQTKATHLERFGRIDRRIT